MANTSSADAQGCPALAIARKLAELASRIRELEANDPSDACFLFDREHHLAQALEFVTPTSPLGAAFMLQRARTRLFQTAEEGEDEPWRSWRGAERLFAGVTAYLEGAAGATVESLGVGGSLVRSPPLAAAGEDALAT
ncbi:MAG TPA: hypothetical protein VGS12_17665 [Caulobacteraceae bacterium]|nr:hypothetical protein [Caulobacteraceae bacterium]